jgi:hypothetical protein
VKTREEIESWHANKRQAIWAKYQQQHKALTDAEDDEIGALNDQYADALKAVAHYDPMLRLIAAAKKVDHGHLGSTNPAIYTSWHRPSAATITGCQRCQEYVDLQSAIDYAEQRRAQG